MSNVKLSKKTVLNSYGEKEVQWWVDGVKYLKNVFIVKRGYQWQICDVDGYPIYNSYDAYFPTKKSIVDYLEQYDNSYEESQAIIEQEKKDQDLEEEQRKNRINKINNEFKDYRIHNHKFAKGDNVRIKLFNWSKVNSIGEAFEGGYSHCNAKVEEVKFITQEIYDIFVTSFLNKNKHGLIFSGGGSSTDKEEYQGYKSFWELPPELQDSYHYDSYERVTIVVAEDRLPIVVNPHGYDYARYVGLMA